MPLSPTTVASVDSYILAAVLFLFILLGFNSRHIARIFRNFFNDMWSLRQRDNIFDEHVATETQSLLLMMLLTSALEGLLLFNYFGIDAGLAPFARFCLYTLIALGFNVFSIAACSVVGYTFTTSALAAQWRRGLNASQAMLGLALLVPTSVVLVRPGFTHAAIIFAIALYIIARLLYVIKGVRIFYRHFYGWVYFILYLCTLEIIPLLVIWRLILNLEENP